MDNPNVIMYLFLAACTVIRLIHGQSIYRNGNDKYDRLQRTCSENEWRMNEKLKLLERKLNEVLQRESDTDNVESLLKEKIERNENRLKELEAANSSSTYVRWGNRKCPPTSTLVYQVQINQMKGYIAGKHHQRNGSGTNTLCLHKTPRWGVYQNGTQGARAFLYGGGYESNDGKRDNFLPGYDARQVDGEVAPCSVCRTKSQRVSLMIPGTTECETGWTKEYEGLLMANKDGEFGSTEYICVDSKPAYLNRKNRGQFLLYSTEMRCGALPCSKYIDGREVTCVVCSS